MKAIVWTKYGGAVAQHDPGVRVLVVVNVRHCHYIRRELKKFPEIRVVDYQDL